MEGAPLMKRSAMLEVMRRFILDTPPWPSNIRALNLAKKLLTFMETYNVFQPWEPEDAESEDTQSQKK